MLGVRKGVPTRAGRGRQPWIGGHSGQDHRCAHVARKTTRAIRLAAARSPIGRD
jgi:hypothetical protein